LSTDAISVQLLYVNPLLGEGLERLLATEHGLDVTAHQLVSGVSAPAGIDADADVVIFEEGGPLGLEALLEQIHSPVVIVMSLHTDKVWTLRRDDLRALPCDVVETIVSTCLERPRITPARAHARAVPMVAGELVP
jgi:hypothetical protein